MRRRSGTVTLKIVIRTLEVTVLPDRVTVPTCIACGAMGRAADCDGECSEHRIALVHAEDFENLRAEAHASRRSVDVFSTIAVELLCNPSTEQDCAKAHRALCATARQALETFEP